MNIEFTARRLKFDDEVKELVETRLAKLSRVLPRDAQAKVLLRAEKRGVAFEITISARQRTWAAEVIEPDQLTAVHAALDKIAAQAKKTKARVKEDKKHTSSGVKAPESWEPALKEEPAARSRGPRTETVAARPMFDEDALYAFSHSKKDVLPYRDPSDDSIRFLYRRKDGMIAILIVA
jgi:ribosomal subunit interface protein